MNFIEKVEIKEFWGKYDVKFKFNKDINFIIGVNGSGKTTVVRLIIAALTGDFFTLYNIDFNKILITLKSKTNRKKPQLIIKKEKVQDRLYSKIEYTVKESSKDKGLKYLLDDDEMMILKRFSNRFILNKNERLFKRYFNSEILVKLKSLVNVSWLPVYRVDVSQVIFEEVREEKEESIIAKKLSSLSTRLIKYFSALEKRSSKLLEEFQKEVFLSIFYSNKQRKRKSSFDYNSAKIALENICKEFNYSLKFFQELENYFKILENTIDKLLHNKEIKLKKEELSVLVGLDRIHYIVEKWNELSKQRKKIFESRDIFLSIINSMMLRKKIEVNNKNELEITTKSGKKLSITDLSSGEKQLLILLGEALLQEGKPCVYIADEPELSLHIKWQESLVKNLRTINPNAQIIFATHSPDIVSVYGNKIFNMEKVINGE